MEIVKEFILSFYHIVMDSSFYILTGFLLAGLLHVFLPVKTLNRLIGTSPVLGIVKGVLIGAPIPICSCGVLPSALSLKKKGVPDSTVAAFLVSTPSTGVDSILTSYALLNLPLTVLKPIVGVIASIVTGISIHLFGKSGKESRAQEKRIIFQGDENILYKRFVKVLDIVKRSGAEEINIAHELAESE